jgi:hypothetical protein
MENQENRAKPDHSGSRLASRSAGLGRDDELRHSGFQGNDNRLPSSCHSCAGRNPERGLGNGQKGGE